MKYYTETKDIKMRCNRVMEITYIDRQRAAKAFHFAPLSMGYAEFMMHVQSIYHHPKRDRIWYSRHMGQLILPILCKLSRQYTTLDEYHWLDDIVLFSGVRV